FTLRNSSAGSPKTRTRSSGSVPTFTSGWKPIARRSPRASWRSMAARQASPYTAHSGSSPRRLSLSGRKTSYPAAPSTRVRSRSAVRNGMSQATHSTGPSPAARTLVAAAPLPFEDHVQAHRQYEAVVGAQRGRRLTEPIRRADGAPQGDNRVVRFEPELVAGADARREPDRHRETERGGLGMV